MALGDCTFQSADSLLENIPNVQVVLQCAGYHNYNIRRMLIIKYALQLNFLQLHTYLQSNPNYIMTPTCEFKSHKYGGGVM